MDNPQLEQIVSLKEEKRQWLSVTVLFYMVLAAVGAVGILANLYPDVMLDEGTTLAIFNAKYSIVFPVLIAATLFFLYGAHLVGKRMKQGFTHYTKTYVIDKD